MGASGALRSQLPGRGLLWDAPKALPPPWGTGAQRSEGPGFDSCLVVYESAGSSFQTSLTVSFWKMKVRDLAQLWRDNACLGLETWGVLGVGAELGRRAWHLWRPRGGIQLSVGLGSNPSCSLPSPGLSKPPNARCSRDLERRHTQGQKEPGPGRQKHLAAGRTLGLSASSLTQALGRAPQAGYLARGVVAESTVPSPAHTLCSPVSGFQEGVEGAGCRVAPSAEERPEWDPFSGEAGTVVGNQDSKRAPRWLGCGHFMTRDSVTWVSTQVHATRESAGLPWALSSQSVSPGG